VAAAVVAAAVVGATQFAASEAAEVPESHASHEASAVAVPATLRALPSAWFPVQVVTSVWATQSPSSADQDPAAQAAQTPLSSVAAPLVAEVRVMERATAAAQLTGSWLPHVLSAVHVSELSQVSAPQESVHVSAAPVAPTVCFLPVSHAETRESEADVQVYVALLAALATVVQVVQSPKSGAKLPAVHGAQVMSEVAVPSVLVRATAAAFPTAT